MMMSRRFEITCTLQSDAEPGTGFGTTTINDLVPRDESGRPCLPATHIKGLARESLARIADCRGWPSSIDARLFGAAGLDGAEISEESRTGQGQRGGVRFSRLRLQGKDVRTESQTPIGVVTRTRIERASGRVEAGSLRTVERVACGMILVGSMVVDSDLEAHEIDALLLAVRSITAVGGNRTRGAGRCIVDISEEGAKAESRSQGALLKSVDGAIARGATRRAPVVSAAAPVSLDAGVAFAELTFDADDPVCCPTTPLSGTNVVRSGFAIPASAVQAVVLHRLSRIDPALGTACLEHPGFRAWPLLPFSPRSEAGSSGSERFPVWVSLSHRVSKHSIGASDRIEAKDRMIEDYDWRTVSSSAPLKGADGVLLVERSGTQVERLLWKASSMPRHVAAHVGLGGDEPRLFTVESMAPMRFRGLLALPRTLLGRLEELLKADPMVAFGRSKTVRGGGRLALRVVDSTAAMSPNRHNTFVAQSPILIPDDDAIGEASEAFAAIIRASGWGDLDLGFPGGGAGDGQARATGTQAVVEIRFGWNTHGRGATIGTTNRLRAVRVIAPGSVFRLASAPRDLDALLVRGIGGGRERGFGAVLPHPGVADRLFVPPPEVLMRRSAGPIAAKVRELVQASEDSGLSASQVGRLVELAGGTSQEQVEAFFKRQQVRPPSVQQRWKSVKALVLKCFVEVSDPAQRQRIFKAWRDVIVAAGGEHEAGDRNS
jgi:hypothetical protein